MHIISSLIYTICKILCMSLIYFERPARVTNCLLLRQKDWKIIAYMRNYLSLHQSKIEKSTMFQLQILHF